MLDKSTVLGFESRRISSLFSFCYLLSGNRRLAMFILIRVNLIQYVLLQDTSSDVWFDLSQLSDRDFDTSSCCFSEFIEHVLAKPGSLSAQADHARSK